MFHPTRTARLSKKVKHSVMMRDLVQWLDERLGSAVR